LIKNKIPDNFRGEFDVNSWITAKNNSDRVAKEYFAEKYDAIMSSPATYPAFNEYVKTLRP
jgi:hypothetical protein